ncbi:MAG: YbjN domain-containing protein [Pseudomonadota bacterium]|jgi:hypothetical protein|nr:YbjN domain-containing protein [Pseudomonadota bacterium]
MSEKLDIFSDVSNPLDSVEDVMASHDWTFDRPHPDELFVHVTGKRGQYRMTFLWQENFSAMQFFCEMDLTIPESHKTMAARALMAINQNLWLGHFDIPEDTNTPIFRHTTLFRGMNQTSGADHIADLIEISLAECERHFSVFHMLSSKIHMNDDVLVLAMADSEGEA